MLYQGVKDLLLGYMKPLGKSTKRERQRLILLPWPNLIYLLLRITDYENSVSKVTATGAGAGDYTDGGKFGGKFRYVCITVKLYILVEFKP